MSASVDLIPEEVRSTWTEIIEELRQKGLESLVKVSKTRVSLIDGRTRWLKYDFREKRWVFCKALECRMDEIDPQQICTRSSEGTRLENSFAIYTDPNLAPLLPILDRLIELVVLDMSQKEK